MEKRTEGTTETDEGDDEGNDEGEDFPQTSQVLVILQRTRHLLVDGLISKQKETLKV